MAFYYLNYIGLKDPADESGYKYLIYVDNEIENRQISLELEPDKLFCAYDVLGPKTWGWNDDELSVLNKQNHVIAKFNKVYDKVGFTVWVNKEFRL